MKIQKQAWATFGLISITVLSAIQYVFLRNVPDDVSTFAFVCITNVIGLLILGAAQIRKITHIQLMTWKKGVLFALELTGFNFFTLLGSRHMDAVIISSVVSLYFVFVTPMLLLLRKKVSFFSSIATVIAIIALLLMFGANTDALFSSIDVVYLILADIFFAAYVVSVSILGEGEDSIQLTFSQMLFASAFAFVGWAAESLITGKSLSLPTERGFWLSALFIGIFIRVCYGLVQITCQKYVSAIKASLIFAAEIVITLITNPFLAPLLGLDYAPITVFQVLGGILFVVATLMVDNGIMSRLGYEDLQEVSYVTDTGETKERSSVSKKVILTTLSFSLITLTLSTVIYLASIQFIRNSAIDSSRKLGEDASVTSAEALIQQLEVNISSQAKDKTMLAEQKLEAYSDAILYAASYVHALYRDKEHYPVREVERPLLENAGIWAMQRNLATEGISYTSVREESGLIGNMEDIFEPIVENNDNIATIYLGTESGLLVSYDPFSDTAVTVGEGYYEYRDSTWYQLGKEVESYAFTGTYQDGYGRGLTITCVAPFTDASGRFHGCVAMDILMSELNDSMVNDGIIDPSVATLIDREGNYIAGKDTDPDAEDMGSIFDEGRDEALKTVGREILAKKNGVISTGEGEDAKYIAFSTIDSTDWTLCILSPVSSIIRPAQMIRESIDENTDDVVATVLRGILTVIQSCLVLSALILIFVTLFAGRVSKLISDPLKKLEADVLRISAGHLEQRTDVSTNDEIGSLAASFNIMTDALQKYIVNLKEVTAREERIASELSVATNIQASMLPQDFGTISTHKEYGIYATMDPAREVGGDFYDFFMVDDDHLCMVMADVSGKGIPAALFMMVSKIILQNNAMMGKSPAQILTDSNAAICSNNKMEMFVTVWLGILEISTGKLVAANAGHEYPVLMQAGGRFELIKDKHGFVIGGMEGVKYKEYELTLTPGAKLFLYTDGVPEATNTENKLFGTERMLAALNENTSASPDELLKNVRCAVDEFVKDAEQFDDLTMLGLEYRGEGGNA